MDQKLHLNALDTDKKRGFITQGPIHIINRSSVEDLNKIIANKYADDKEALDSIDCRDITFKP